MNRKQAELKAEKWLISACGCLITPDVKSLTNLLLRIDKAAYKRGVKDGEKCVWRVRHAK